MAVINHAPEVAGLQLSQLNTLEQINKALDIGDRRAFMTWAKRWATLSARLEQALLRIVTAEYPA